MVQALHLRKDQIENRAINLLETAYNRPIEEVPLPIDLDALLECMDLTLDFDDLAEREGKPDVHGALYVQESLVLIDFSLDPIENPKKEGRCRFTIGHEIGHAYLHAPLIPQESPGQLSLLNTNQSEPFILCRISENSQIRRVERDWIEWQADFFSANTIMPTPHVRRDYENFWVPLEINWNQMPTPRNSMAISNILNEMFTKPSWSGFIEFMTQRYRVSKEAMEYRLAELNLFSHLTQPVSPLGIAFR